MSVGVLAQRLITHVCIGPKAHAEDCSSSEEGENVKREPTLVNNKVILGHNGTRSLAEDKSHLG